MRFRCVEPHVPPQLSMVMDRYDRMWPLVTRSVQPEGIELNIVPMSRRDVLATAPPSSRVRCLRSCRFPVI